MSLSIQNHIQNLSFSRSLTYQNPLFLHSKLSHLTLQTHLPPNPKTTNTTIIRMGGGPRTYPGGVSKWQWKRMQAKKAKQLLKARLCRERQIYEMRKRAELKAAVSELERPWEVVEKAPNLFSVKADEQLKVLADRFQKPGGFDMWTEKDGPQLFQTPDELPSARFFPKGVVHSVKPYRRISGSGELGDDEEDGLGSENGNSGLIEGGHRNGDKNVKRSSGRNFRGGSGSGSGSFSEEGGENGESSSSEISSESPGNQRVGRKHNGRLRNKKNRRRFGSVDLNGSGGGFDSGQSGFNRKQRWQNGRYSRGNCSSKLNDSQSEVYDMSLQQDGSYGFRSNNSRYESNSGTNNRVEFQRF